MTRLCFIDTETTSLDAETGEIWEVGLIVRETVTKYRPGDGAQDGQTEHHWMLPVALEHADPIALSIGRFHERHPQGNACDLATDSWRELDGFAHDLAELTHGAHLVGNVVSFDEERLRRLLRSRGVMPSWHYHLIDVEALAVGWLMGRASAAVSIDWDQVDPPWSSEKLSRALGVELPTGEERHTALGDARWAARLFDAVMAVEIVWRADG